MLDTIPNKEKKITVIGESLYDIWNKLCAMIDEIYDMECLWDLGGKAWQYEYKYRKGGKTLCALYARENCIGFLVILGQNERAKFEQNRDNFTHTTQKIYDETQTYHDGKWLMFKPTDTSMFDDFIKLLELKESLTKIKIRFRLLSLRQKPPTHKRSGLFD